MVDVFTGELVFVDSEGEFTEEEWVEAVERGKKEGMLREEAEDGEGMVVDEGEGVGEVLKRVVEEKVRREMRWKDGGK